MYLNLYLRYILKVSFSTLPRSYCANYRFFQDCIDLVEAKSKGIFALLDEESKLPKPRDPIQ